MVIKERLNGDTSGTLVCPHCKKWLYLVAESFESITLVKRGQAIKKKKVYKKVLTKLFRKENVRVK